MAALVSTVSCVVTDGDGRVTMSPEAVAGSYIAAGRHPRWSTRTNMAIRRQVSRCSQPIAEKRALLLCAHLEASVVAVALGLGLSSRARTTSNRAASRTAGAEDIATNLAVP